MWPTNEKTNVMSCNKRISYLDPQKKKRKTHRLLLLLMPFPISAVLLCHVLHNDIKKEIHILNFLCCQMFFQLNNDLLFIPSQCQNDYLLISLPFLPHSVFCCNILFLYCLFKGENFSLIQ